MTGQCKPLHSLILGPIESATDDKTSFGFKPYRSTKDAYAYLHICLNKKNAPEWIVEGDIKACLIKSTIHGYS